MKHLTSLVSVNQLDHDMIFRLFRRASEMRVIVKHGGSQRLTGHIGAMLFYEPSTRTRFSFEAALKRLGGSVIGTESAGHFSSVTKGETLEDTVMIVAGYADLIVLRHPETGAAARAAAVCDVPIINAGDGTGEHPTQALLDAFTIYDKLGTLQNLTVTMVGDLKHGRTVHSLVRLLRPYNPRFLFVAPDSLQMPGEILAELAKANTRYEQTVDFERAIKTSDVLYMLRLQKERLVNSADADKAEAFTLNADRMKDAKAKMIVMHPLPRVKELDTDMDTDPRAAYFEQAQNGLYIRMALLELLLRCE